MEAHSDKHTEKEKRSQINNLALQYKELKKNKPSLKIWKEGTIKFITLINKIEKIIQINV
jgi:hypothetical protein